MTHTRKAPRKPLTLVGLANRIGTVLAVTVYTYRNLNQQWTVTFRDDSLRYIYRRDNQRRQMPVGYGVSLDEAANDFIEHLRGGIIHRDPHNIGKGVEWPIPRNLAAWEP